jgi:hypothetical protein
MITVEWDSPDSNIICYTVAGKWTWDEFYSALNRARALMAQSPAAKVDFIVNMQHGSTLPSGAITHFSRLARVPHTKSDRMVLVGVNRFIKTFFDVFGKIYPARMHKIFIAQSVEEARSKLVPHDKPPSDSAVRPSPDGEQRAL